MLKTYPLHPATIKHIKRGHFWVTKDKFSDKFDKNIDFFIGCEQRKNFALFLNDSNHPQIKARLWSKNIPNHFSSKDFLNDFKIRLDESLGRRTIEFDRDNFYLVFGEADQLPGFFLQQLGGILLIQTYSNIWSKYQKNIINILKTIDRLKELKGIWWQERNKGREKKFNYFALSEKTPVTNEIINEFGAKYELKFDENYDIGIYTDMSSIRNGLIPLFKKDQKVLNLYSYTGAYSVLPLIKQMHVTSVDLSSKYMSWLENNISLNECDESKHRSIVKNTEKAISKLIEENQKFNLIISDPPTSSSDGKKRTNSFDFYKKNLEKLYQLLSNEGHLIAFINTHKMTRNQFNSAIENSLEEIDLNKKLKVVKKLKLGKDCPTVSNFHEGDYLKGLVLKRIN